MDKTGLSERLKIAVTNTHGKYHNFQGIVLFGSFVKPEVEHPGDVDFIPVLGSYEGCWEFSTDDEGDYDAFYRGYKKMEAFFGTHFTEFAKGRDAIFKTYRKKDGLFHVESLVALDNLPELKKGLDSYGAKPENFIGTGKAARTILNFYSSSTLNP